MSDPLSWRPLAGLRVGLLGSGRALRFGGRTFAAVGADVVRVAAPGVDPPSWADSSHGGESERERRLDSWLDADVTVVPHGGDSLADVAEQHLENAAVVLCDVDLAHRCPTGRPKVVVDMGVGDDAPACGLTAAARGGVAVAIGASERPALGLPFDLADYATGLVVSVAGLDLLLSGASSAEVSAVRVLATFAGVNALVYEPYGIPWRRERRRASQCGGPYPYGFWEARDGYVCAICRTRTEWERLLDALGRPAWSEDPKYAHLRRNGAEHADELDALIERWSSGQTRSELQLVAERHGVAMAPVRTAREVLADPALSGTGFLSPADGQRPPRPGIPFATGAGAPANDGAEAPPLSSARVLDLGWVWSAPLVTSGLADMGADVVKIEHDEHPDSSRVRGRPQPGWTERQDAPSIESVPYFLNLNSGKRSAAIDLKDPVGLERARSLVERADIVVENLGVRVFDRLGLRYEELSRANPGLIWISMTARLHEREQMRGYAPTLSSHAGLESAVGYPGDLTGMMTFGLCDPVAGMWGLLAALTAWRERARTGRGRYIRLGQVEGLLALLGEQHEQADREGDVEPAGDVHPYFNPYGCFTAADGGEVAVAALDDEQRAGLADILGSALESDALEATLRTFIEGRPAEEVLAALRGVVACEPVATFGAARADPALVGMGMLAELEHPLAGRHVVYTQPWNRDGAPLPIARPAPVLGSDTEAVLEEWRS